MTKLVIKFKKPKRSPFLQLLSLWVSGPSFIPARLVGEVSLESLQVIFFKNVCKLKLGRRKWKRWIGWKIKRKKG